MGPRMIALAVVVVLLATGPLSPVMAQQAAQPAAQTEVSPDAVPATSERPSLLGGAGYNTAATVITVVKAPFNVVLCGIGSALGMKARELMAVSSEPAQLDAAAVRPGDRVRLAVRRRDDQLVLVRIEKEP